MKTLKSTALAIVIFRENVSHSSISFEFKLRSKGELAVSPSLYSCHLWHTVSRCDISQRGQTDSCLA